MNREPTVSVVLAVRNGERTVGAAMRSVLAQPGVPFEVLVGNDASTDRTASVLEAFDDHRIRLFHNPVNLGAGPTRDRLIREARGRWITFIDADDEWRAERLATLLDVAAGDESLLVFDDLEECHDAPCGLVPWRRIHGAHGFSASGAPVQVTVPRFLRGRSTLIKPLFSRSLCIASDAAHGAYRFGEDSFFLLALIAGGGRLVYVPEAMYRYRITPGSATGSAGRFAALREVLQDSLHRFDADPAIRHALEGRIARARRREDRLAFTGALRQRRFGDAARVALGDPALFIELLRHNLHMFPYHLHRLAHGGSARRGSE